MRVNDENSEFRLCRGDFSGAADYALISGIVQGQPGPLADPRMRSTMLRASM